MSWTRKNWGRAGADQGQGSESLACGTAKGTALQMSEMAASLWKSVAQEMSLWNLRAEHFIPSTEIPRGWNLWHLFSALQRVLYQNLEKLLH